MIDGQIKSVPVILYSEIRAHLSVLSRVATKSGQFSLHRIRMEHNDDETRKLLPNIAQEPISTSSSSRYLFFGCCLAFLSGLIFTGNNVVIQTQHLDYSEILLVRSLVQLGILSTICRYKKSSLWPSIGEHPFRIRLLMVLQGFFGALMIVFGFCCVLFLPLGDALTLLFSAPLSTMIVAAIFLRHRLRFFKIISGILLLIGTVFVIQPEFLFSTSQDNHKPHFWFFGLQLDPDAHDGMYYIGVGLALGSAITDGFLNVAISYCQEVESLVLLWWTAFSSLIVSLLSFTFDPNARMLSPDIVNIPSTEWTAYFMMAFSGMAAYFCMTKSLQMIDPTIVAFIRSLEIILAYIVQFAIIGDIPNTLSLIGASIVLLCVTAMTLQTFLISLVPERFQFLC